jgi:hypothetical protein
MQIKNAFDVKSKKTAKLSESTNSSNDSIEHLTSLNDETFDFSNDDFWEDPIDLYHIDNFRI